LLQANKSEFDNVGNFISMRSAIRKSQEWDCYEANFISMPGNTLNMYFDTNLSQKSSSSSNWRQVKKQQFVSWYLQQR